MEITTLINPLLETKEWSLDHVAIAVNNLDESIELYHRFFHLPLQVREIVTTHKVEVAFLSLPNSRLELISPLPGNETVKRFLLKRGEGLHHLGFLVNSIENELKRLDKLGVELIDRSARLGAENSLVAFLKPQSTKGVLIELIERKVS